MASAPPLSGLVMVLSLLQENRMITLIFLTLMLGIPAGFVMLIAEILI